MAGCSQGLPSSASSDFERGDEGWTIEGDTSLYPQWSATGGNPAGMVSATDGVTGQIWYFVAPKKFLGDQSAAYGSKLTFDLKQSNTFNQVDAEDVILTGRGLALVTDTRKNPATTWTPFAVKLDESEGWRKGDLSGPPATAEDFQLLLKSLTGLRIRGEYIDGPDVGSLDNVYLGSP